MTCNRTTCRVFARAVLVLMAAAALLPGARADIVTGLQTYWRLDDGSGSPTAADFTGYGSTGGLTNFADLTYTSMWTSGEVGSAVAFNQNGATSNYISVPDSPYVNFAGPRAFTLAAWVKLSVDGTLQTSGAPIIYKGDGAKESYSLDVTGGKFRVLMRNSNGNSTAAASSATSPVAGVWYHVAGYWDRSYSSARVGVWVNGVPDGANSGATLTTDYTTSFPLTIGCKPNALGAPYNVPFQGTIDEVRMYNRRLTDADVAELYAATSLNIAPGIMVQPTNAVVNQGAAFTNSVVAMGSAPLSYQWYRDYVLQPGKTSATLILNPVQASDESANWYVTVTSPYGSATSTNVSLVVNSAPSLVQPVSTNVVLFAGGKSTLFVTASGALPLYYQWQSNGVAVANATNSSFTVSDAPIGFSASFFCVVTNFLGSVSSTPVQVSVIAAPTAPYPVAVLADNPRGYWRLNEPDNGLLNGNAGVLAHDYWGGNDGNYTNATLAQLPYNSNVSANTANPTDPADTSALFGPGPDSWAGNIQGVDFAAATNSNGNFSIEAWVNAQGNIQSSGAGIIAKGYGNGGEQFCLDNQSSTTGLRFFVRDSSGATHNCNSTFLLDSFWHHVVGVCNESAGLVSLYIDGRLAATTTITPGSGIRSSADPMVIGARKSASTSTYFNNQFNGDVDEVAVYGYALTPQQIVNHYTAAGTAAFISQAPPVAVTVNENSALTLPATVAGTPPITNIWTDPFGGVIAQTVLTGTNTGSATLNVTSVPANWNNGTLVLATANAYGSTSTNVSLTVNGGLPVFVKNLLPTVTTVAGKAYVYSVSVTGAEPFNYQWYSNNVPLAGETASSYAFAAAAGTYRVTVRNGYGTVSSTTSTMTTIPQLTTPYAAAVLGAGAVGYWPLQETTAPAAVTKEINYGTLGAIGNAYYASSNISFAQPGALTASGNSDTCAGFTGGDDSYAFVPRINPALTVRPPFSVECWVFPVDGAFHDILGQSGSGLNAPGNGGNWAGFRLCQGNPSGGPTLQFYTAIGSGNTKNNAMTPDNSLVALAWHHCVATYDGATVILYIDGVPLMTNTVAMAIDTWTPFTIGGSMFYSGIPQRHFNSTVDEVAVYTNILSDAQVLSHYTAGATTGGNYSQAVLNEHPTLYYRMNCAGYTTPNPYTFPEAVNYGSAAPNAAYMAGIVPGGVSGASLLGASGNVAAPINGILSCVDAGYVAEFDRAGTQPLTALTWFKTYPADGRVQTLLSHGKNWALNLDGTTGRIVWNLYAGGQVTSTNILNDGKWHLAAGVSDGTTTSLYVDGVLNSSAAVAGAMATESSANLFLGGNADYLNVAAGTQRNLAGAIAHAAYFTSALTATQIKSLYTLATVPTVSLAPSGSQLIINYTGTLLSSPNADGTYEPVSGATSPYTVPQTAPQMFYRASRP